MNKNLKKVISAVAALALSASSFVAFAATYPDVDASASYKNAVDELSALKVIEGYEDGTFQPDKLVNRAEFAKMVITALGSSELSQANAAKGQDTKFTDVKGDHWASGFVRAAVSNSIINGFEDNTFRPDANITYAQAMKMLVCAAGYEQWSMDRGGWPDGYMYWGNQLNVGNGVKDVNDTTEITRAQCAQMIDNILNVPICVDTHRPTYDHMGNLYSELEAKNGYGVNFQSILTKNHKAYKVKGTVANTNRASGNTIDADEVQFTIQNARNWLDWEDQISKSNDNAEMIRLKVGDSNIDDYLKQYVEVLIQETDDEEYVAISAAIAGQTDKVELNSADHAYDDERYPAGGVAASDYLYFYDGSKTPRYKLADDVTMYVNGVEFTDINAAFDAYVNDKAGTVTIIDTPSNDNNTTDGYYDLIFVDAYATLIVDYVDDAESEEPTINLIDSDVSTNSWDIDFTDDDVSYDFVKDGQAISVADLAQFDVLSVKYDVTESDFTNSYFYEVIVSSETESGKYSSYKTKDSGALVYTINGTQYEVNSQTVPELEGSATYNFYIDAFGKIAYAEEESSVQNYAILDSVYGPVRGEDYEAVIILPDGSKLTKVLKETDKANADDEYTKEVTNAYNLTFVDGDPDGDKKPVYERVIKYSINNTTDELTIKTTAKTAADTGENYVTAKDQEYKASGNKLGSVRLSDNTSFISYSSTDKKDIAAMDASTLKDGNIYTVYAYGKSKTDNSYRLVLVEDSIGAITASSNLAIYSSKYRTTDSSDNEVDALEVYVGGANTTNTDDENAETTNTLKTQTIIIESGSEAEGVKLEKGTVILYTTNAQGEIRTITPVLEGYSDTASLWSVAKKDTASIIEDSKDYIKTLGTTRYPNPDLFFGAIVGRTTKSIEISDIKDNVSDLVSTNDFGYDEDVNIYVIDYNKKSDDRIYVGNASSVVKSSMDRNAEDEINWNDNNGKNTNPNLALVKTINSEATDIIVIIPKKGVEVE